jgi:hypothetical protein
MRHCGILSHRRQSERVGFATKSPIPVGPLRRTFATRFPSADGKLTQVNPEPSFPTLNARRWIGIAAQ